MENLKIRIPCEEVSKLVQEKAFQKGYKWLYGDSNVKYTDKEVLTFYDNGQICFMGLEDIQEHENKEISWQEWVYGEGFFFTHRSGSENIYFQAKDSGCVHWYYAGHVNTTCYTWKQFLGSSWIETDMFGNKLEEKEMEQNVKLYDDKINVELTAYQVAVIKALFGEMRGATRDRVFGTMGKHLPYSSGKDAIMPHDYVTTSTSFLEKVEALLENNGYVKEAPKPIKEMTLAQVCEELGYDVKIKKE